MNSVANASLLLHEQLRESVILYRDRIAVSELDRSASYWQLDRLAARFALDLSERGVMSGDRVGIWMDKSILCIAAMQAVLRLGAAYVPLDPLSPKARILGICNDCDVSALVANKRYANSIQAELPESVRMLVVDGSDFDALLQEALEISGYISDDYSDIDPDAMAFILYTSGSTGMPKGVCISHRNASAFALWVVDCIGVSKEDRFANHASFHFDLSVSDIYAAFATGASVCLIPDSYSKSPKKLVEFVRSYSPTIWYSVPSALLLMMEYGGLLERGRFSMRAILFAGESFPPVKLRALRRHDDSVRLLNFFGPTETNVCTAYEVGDFLDGALKAVPIGRAACSNRISIIGEDGREVEEGDVGEIVVEGPTVMMGYWGEERLDGTPYRTGDMAFRNESGELEFVGRRDHLVKVRGFRIGLNEVEAVLGSVPAIREVAVMVTGEGLESKLVAFLSSAEGAKASIIDLKRYCSERLPRYMIIDSVRWMDALPRNRNGKIDRKKLTAEFNL